MIAHGEVNINDVREGIKRRFGEENVAKIADAYAEAYEGSGMNADEIWEEIICDSLGDMNVFAPVELLGEMNSEFLSNLKEEVKKNAKSERGPPANEKRMSREYENADINTDVLNLVSKVQQGKYKDNDDVTLKPPTKAVLDRLSKIMGIDYSGYKVVVEARQINHILKDHGENGKTDQSMRDAQDIAKIEYTLSSPDSIEKAGKTQAYSYMLNGYNRTADTVRYEKSIGDSSYYVIQAVPVANKKTLYVVSAFIGKSGYKKGTSQLIDAKGLNATAEHGSVVIPNNIIPQKSDLSTESEKKVHDGNNIGTFSQSENDIRFSRELDLENMESANVSTPKLSNRAILANALESVVQKPEELEQLRKYKARVAEAEELEAHLAKVNRQINEITFTKGADRSLLPALKEDKIKKLGNERKQYLLNGTKDKK